DRVPDVIEPPLGLRRFRFLVGQRSQAARAPVDDVLAAVDQALLVQAHERLAHRARELRLQRELRPRPVARTTDGTELLENCGAGTVDEVPHALDKRLPADLLAGSAFGGKLSLHDVLRSDAGVVG